MKRNVGTIDKIVRVSIAVVLGILCSTVVDGILAYLFGAIAGVFALTSLVGYCPLYSLFGVNSCNSKCCKKCEQKHEGQ